MSLSLLLATPRERLADSPVHMLACVLAYLVLMQVRIVISERDQVDPLTGTRNVRICGPPEAVQMAQQILHQKIAEAAALSTARMSR